MISSILLTLGMALGLQTAAPEPYALGQVWEYHTRQQDEGSLLKIQKIELMEGEPVYHISIRRVRLQGEITEIQHLPVSAQTLRASVIRKTSDPGDFPSADEGIKLWREAEGGVFAITIAEAVEFAETTIATRKN